MSKLTTAAGAPVPDNQNVITAGRRGPMLLQDVWHLEKLAHFAREVIPERPVLQIETLDSRGLVEVQTITVPNVDGWASKVGKQVNLPVRAWAPNAKVGFMFEAPAAGSAPVAA